MITITRIVSSFEIYTMINFSSHSNIVLTDINITSIDINQCDLVESYEALVSSEFPWHTEATPPEPLKNEVYQGTQSFRGMHECPRRSTVVSSV